MKTLSPFSLAAVLGCARLFALSMYIPSAGENAAAAAVAAVILAAVKLVLYIPVCKALTIGKSGDILKSKPISLLLVAVCAVMLLSVTDSFSEVMSAVYPDRFIKLGAAAVWFVICAYIASMGSGAVGKSSAIMLPVFLVALAVIFIEMRGSMLSDRINLYSRDLSAELWRIVSQLCAHLIDLPIFVGMKRYLKGSPYKAASLYVTADCIISVVFFMMCASVLGTFRSESGFTFFTLAYCTHGEIFDRADGIFIAISTACGLAACSALFIIIGDCITCFRRTKSAPPLLAVAATLTAILLCIYARGLDFGKAGKAAGIGFGAAAVAISLCAGVMPRRERTAESL